MGREAISFVILLVVVGVVSVVSTVNATTLLTTNKIGRKIGSQQNTFVESFSPFHTIKTNRDSLTSYVTFEHPNARDLREFILDPKTDWTKLAAINKRSSFPSLGKAMTSDTNNNRFGFLPVYKASALNGAASVTWSAKCFQQNSAVFDITSSGSEATLIITAEKPKDLTCHDAYLFADSQNFFIKIIYIHGQHTIKINNFKPNELQDLRENGLRIFEFDENIFEAVVQVWSFYSMLNGKHLEEDNVKFLSQTMNITFAQRKFEHTYLNASEIHSGDFLGITRLDGLDPMIMYGTGSMYGHTAVAIRFEDGLYVTESTAPDPFGKSYWPPPYGIIRTPYEQWIQQAIAADYMVTLNPLAPELRAIFNETAAREFFFSREGLPYGYHNFVYGWIDTVSDNFPPPLNSENLAIGLSLLDHVIHDNISSLFIEGLNMRFLHYFGIQEPCPDMVCVFQTLERLNMTLMDVMILVERDEWQYSDGYSMVCDVWVMEVYKAAGIFGSLTDSIQGTEFTPGDLTQIQVFDPAWQRPEPCLANGDDFPYCQMLGKYEWNVPKYNQIPVYANMNEHCGCMWPEYIRSPQGC